MNLFDATLALAKTTTRVRYSTITNGIDKLSLTDTGLNAPDDYYTGGTIWFTSGDNADNSRKINDWDNTTNIMSWLTALTNNTATGDKYAISPYDWTRDELITSINLALGSIGRVMEVDKTTAVVNDQMEYTLPSGVDDVRKITIYDTSSKVEIRVYNYSIINGILKFTSDNRPTDTSNYIYIYYVKTHAELSDDDDVINDLIHPDLLRWTAAVELFRTKQTEPRFQQALQIAMQNQAREVMNRGIILDASTPKASNHLERYY